MKKMKRKPAEHNVHTDDDKNLNDAMKLYDKFDEWLEQQDCKEYWDRIPYVELELKSKPWSPSEVIDKTWVKKKDDKEKA